MQLLEIKVFRSEEEKNDTATHCDVSGPKAKTTFSKVVTLVGGVTFVQDFCGVTFVTFATSVGASRGLRENMFKCI
mgnify:CR=1 FL=1